MKNLYLIFSFVSILLGVVSYIAMNNYIIAIILSVISILFFFFLIIPTIRNYVEEINRYHILHQFINSFIISLSITDSIELSFANAKTMTNTMLSDISSIYELIDVFPFYTYRLFSDVMRMWEEEGGDILRQSEYLLKSSRNIEERIIESNRHTKKTLVDFIVLWTVALSIMMFIRIALKQFYGHMVQNFIYQIGISLVILFFLFSVYMFTKKATNIELNKVKEDE